MDRLPVTAETPATRSRIASMSSSENGVAVPAPPCERPERDEPGETVSMLVPRRLMLRSTS